MQTPKRMSKIEVVSRTPKGVYIKGPQGIELIMSASVTDLCHLRR